MNELKIHRKNQEPWGEWVHRRNKEIDRIGEIKKQNTINQIYSEYNHQISDFDEKKMNLTKEDRRWIDNMFGNKLIQLLDLIIQPEFDRIYKTIEISREDIKTCLFNETKTIKEYIMGLNESIENIDINMNAIYNEINSKSEIPKKTRKKKEKKSPINTDLSKLGF